MPGKGNARTVDLTDPSTWPTFKVTVVRYRKIREYADIVVVAPDEDVAANLGVSAARTRQRRRKLEWTGAKCVESDIGCYSKVEKVNNDVEEMNNGNQ